VSRYVVKEVFLTLQGEGKRAGTKAVFVRFSGCNLWDGHPLHRDRGKGPCAKWCDTDFFKGTPLDLDEIMHQVGTLWAPSHLHVDRWVVLTGGEPTLQIDNALVAALHRDGWRIAVETNGTVDNDALRLCDHICLSPKRGTAWQTLGNAHEVKVVFPGGWSEADLADVQQPFPGAELFVQPQAGHPEAVARCVAWVLANPSWRLSVQLHKALGIR